MPPQANSRLNLGADALTPPTGVSSLAIDRAVVSAFAAILLIYGFLAATLIQTRLPWIDEAWVANPAINLVNEGKLVTTFFEPANPDIYQSFSKATYWMPPGWFLLEAVHFRIFGAGLSQQRALSALFGALLLCALYIIVIQIFKRRRAALAAVGFTAIDFVFLEHAADGRMDMAAATCVFASYALYLALREKSLRGALLAANGALVIAGLIHPIAIVGVGGLAWLVFFLDRGRLRLAQVPWVLASYLAGGVAWGAYIAQDPAAFVAQFLGKTPAPTFNIATAIHHELTLRYRGMFGLDAGWKVASFPQFAVGVIYGISSLAVLINAVLSKKRPWILLGGLWAAHALGMTFLISLKADYHFPIIIPLYASLAAVVLAFPFRGKAGTFITVLVAAILASAQLRVVTKRISIDPLKNYFTPALAEVRKAATAGKFVSASPEFAYPLGFPSNVLHDYNLGFFSGRRPDLIVFSGIGKLPTAPGDHPTPLSQHLQKVITTDYVLSRTIGPYLLYVAKGASPSQPNLESPPAPVGRDRH
jgi:4-amino-4-deoxy-L-arabinose transferase-like glycosyltransferase